MQKVRRRQLLSMNAWGSLHAFTYAGSNAPQQLVGRMPEMGNTSPPSRPLTHGPFCERASSLRIPSRPALFPDRSPAWSHAWCPRQAPLRRRILVEI